MKTGLVILSGKEKKLKKHLKIAAYFSSIMPLLKEEKNVNFYLSFIKILLSGTGFSQSFSVLRRQQKQNHLLRFFYFRVKPVAPFPV